MRSLKFMCKSTQVESQVRFHMRSDHWLLTTRALCIQNFCDWLIFVDKSGILPEDAATLVEYIVTHCHNMEFKGLMTIGSLDHSLVQGDNPDFLTLVDLCVKVGKKVNINPATIDLSMGMSHDFEHAVRYYDPQAISILKFLMQESLTLMLSRLNWDRTTCE